MLALALVGALTSLVALIPPVRRRARGSAAAATALVVAVAVSALVISFVLYAALDARATYAFSIVGTPLWQAGEDPLLRAVVRELWIRNLVPPPWRQPCYSRDAQVCQRANWVVPDSVASDDWDAYLKGVAICLVSSLSGCALSRRWIHRGRRRDVPPPTPRLTT
jgi:hypothetical protein